MIENFDAESIAADRVGRARWTAHTPWSGDFGEARFADPGPAGPFKIKDGILAAADASGAGSGTHYGYFEARMKMPPGPGVWPAFWLAALKPAKTADGNIEIDVVEYYGQFGSAYQIPWGGG
jgi:hypothetical protein